MTPQLVDVKWSHKCRSLEKGAGRLVSPITLFGWDQRINVSPNNRAVMKACD